MKKAKIYIPAKTAMQSGRGKLKSWVLEFVTKDPSINPLMGWESSTDTLEEVVLKFSSKEKAIEYAKKIIFLIMLLNLIKKNLLLNHTQTIFLKIKYVEKFF